MLGVVGSEIACKGPDGGVGVDDIGGCDDVREAVSVCRGAPRCQPCWETDERM